MANLLANIFSAAESLKRSVGDMVRNPVAQAEKAIGYGLDRSKKFQEDLATAQSKSVLVPEWQKAESYKRATDAVTDVVGGNAGIIVPVGALPGMTRRNVIELSYELSKNPAAAWINHGVHRQPQTSAAVKNISDKGQSVNPDLLLSGSFNSVRLNPGTGRTPQRYKLEDVISLDRYPPDLQEYFRSLTVGQKQGAGAEFYPDGRINLGKAGSAQEMTSNLLHELQHGSQYFYDMPRGGNPISFFQDYGKFSTAKIRGEQLLDSLARQGKHPVGDAQAFSRAGSQEEVLNNPDAINSILGMLKKVDNKAHSQYSAISGEVEARLVQRLFEHNDIGIPTQIMKNQMGMNPDNLINPASVRDMPKVDADPVTQAVINVLLGVGK